LDHSPLPLQCSGRFLKIHQDIHLASKGSVIPRPPAAASAAGGRRIADSLFVHSVSSLRVPLVCVEEEETPTMQVLKTAPSPFVGGVLQSSDGVRASSSSSAFYGSSEFFFPHADRRRPIWYQLILEMKMAWSLAMKTTASDVGPQGPLTGDFPAAQGLLPFQGVREQRRIRRATGSSSSALSLGSRGTYV
jgi:hypothetical protein